MKQKQKQNLSLGFKMLDFISGRHFFFIEFKKTHFQKEIVSLLFLFSMSLKTWIRVARLLILHNGPKKAKVTRTYDGSF